MVICDVGADGNTTVLETVREPVRLGREVFATGELSDDTIDRAVEAFGRLRTMISKAGVSQTRAVATSAVREASNSATIIERVLEASGIPIEAVSAAEEARLIHLAVSRAVDIGDRLAMLVDIGGGSVEVTMATEDDILLTDSYKAGGVRMSRPLDDDPGGRDKLHEMVVDHVDATMSRMKEDMGAQKIDCCLGTGGSIESLGELGRTLYGKSRTKLGADELAQLVEDLEPMTTRQRIEELGLRPDRADVIAPAAIVLNAIINRVGIEEIQIPHVGLKEGLLADLAGRILSPRRPEDRLSP